MFAWRGLFALIGLFLLLTEVRTELYVQENESATLAFDVSSLTNLLSCSWNFRFSGSIASVNYIHTGSNVVASVVPNRSHILQHYELNTQTYGLTLKKAIRGHSTKYAFHCSDTAGITILENSSTVVVFSLPGPPKLAYNPSQVIASQDSTFTCTSTGGYPNPAIKWVVGSSPTPLSSQTTTGPDNTLTSTVKINFSKQDHGKTLKCVAFLNNPKLMSSSQKNATTSLNILYGPVVSFDIQYDPYIIIKGNQSASTIMCLADANPSRSLAINWFMNGNLQSANANQTSFSVLRKGRHTLKCEVTNSIGTGSDSKTVIVQSTPSIQIQQKHFQPIEGQSELRVNCTADGYPAPSVFWRNSSDLAVTPDSKKTSILTLSPVSRKVGGTYKCLVSVKLTPSGMQPWNESLVKDIVVDVQYLPGQPTITGLKTSEYETDELLRLTCSMSEDKLGNPHGKIMWSKDGETITNEETLIIPKLKLGDMGDYLCVASNTLGNGEPIVAQVEVKGRPEIVRPYKKAVAENANVNITCTALSSADVTFAWARNGKVLQPSGVVKTSFYHYTSYVNLIGVTSNDYGNYSCSATNEYGLSTHYLQVVGFGMPEAPLNLRVKTKTWQAVVLRWDPGFDGGKTAVFYVLQNGVKVQQVSDNVTTQVQGLMPETMYNFQVHAYNERGRGPNSVRLEVMTTKLEYPTVKVELEKENKTISLDCTNCDYRFYAVVQGKVEGGNYIDIVNNITFDQGNVVLSLGENTFDFYRTKVCFWNRTDVCQYIKDVGEAHPQHENPNPMTLVIVVSAIACVCLLAMICVIAGIFWRRRHETTKRNRFGNPGQRVDNQYVNREVSSDSIEPDYTSRENLAKLNGNGYHHHAYNTSRQTSYEGPENYTYSVVNKPASQVSRNGHVKHNEVSKGVFRNQVYDGDGRTRLESDYEDPDPLPPYSSRPDTISMASSKSPIVQDTESGYSTPLRKSKKVIYEVIV